MRHEISQSVPHPDVCWYRLNGMGAHSAGGLKLLPKIQKRRGLTGPQFSEKGCWEKVG